ncbi:hypothetical protein Tco_0707173 [Tanacetum coccineum]|uniref:Uncharacterized protein n=1 Tax=Tanacetum coccineum TaxID=301880 RepID=A0ABQ4YB27_9ASTR
MDGSDGFWRIMNSGRGGGDRGEGTALELDIERLLIGTYLQNYVYCAEVISVIGYIESPTKLIGNEENGFERCIIKKESEYAKLWNDWYKKAQLGDLKGKSKDTSCVSDTLDSLSQKLENENVELEFLVLNYAKENGHLKTTYKNLFDSIP